MKLSFLSPASILKGLKTVFFHPMLYTALVFHWSVLNLPSPVDKTEELNEEELLDDSIPIASSASLGVKSKKSPQENTKPKAKKKEKPKPLAEALVKSDPELAKLAEEKKRQELEAEKKAEEEKRKAEEKKQLTAKKEEDQDKQKEKVNSEGTNKEDSKEEVNSEDENKADNTDENSVDESSQDDSSEGSSTVKEFNLELLPKPELIFTADSIASYNPGFNQLVLQRSIIDARVFETTTSVDQAISYINQSQDFKDLKIDGQIFEDGEDEGKGVGVVHQGQKSGETVYLSFIRRSYTYAKKHKKRSLRSSLVFVIWKENPV